jgi:hypothetical protein
MDQFNINTINRQNADLANKNNELREKNNSIFQQGQNLKDSQNANASLKNEVNDLARQNADMANQVTQSEISVMAANIQRNITQEENEKLKSVLNRPLMEIISENERLRAAMEKQQALLEEWMLSQKAFKVLAVKYGEKTNVSTEKFAQDVTLAKEQIKEGKKMAEIKLS